ncbi:MULTISPECIES: hypothetical protein [Actinoalloteichus]|uniref:Uncharacterized protein n=1 Tax=Actinoalloteichus fjordicus TaxID=1612552 RepID=A0AAC9PV46_9PSEU|nr:MULTISPECIES: hypothetical protein [Actinoalloteichus]APU17720.1 hypothetical protein UA74_28605 [Actinoalloteichus fjordicus]APU23798.1 hypothetical protein UA75_29135 [Actinoalloteichus sp. GBA129-24]
MHSAGYLLDRLTTVASDLPVPRLTANRTAGVGAAAELREAWQGSVDERAWEAVGALSRAAEELESAFLLLVRLDESVRAYATVL